jgi:hypothetical protein
MLATLIVLVSLAADPPAKPAGAIRFATFNASLNRDRAGALIEDLSTRDDPQARNVAEIIQRTAPDVLLVNEFDFEPGGKAAELFQRNYLSVSQNGAPPIDYPHRYTAEVNTGIATGFDLDNDGQVVNEPGTRGYGNDAQGFGQFPGQYGMVVYSKYPIDQEGVRKFDRVLWRDMPRAMLPAQPDGSPWYSTEELAVLRLSSKAHWDIPILIDGKVIHVLVSHPTPPAFDGPEDRNGKRNHDEIRLWADYLTGGEKAAYLKAGDPPRTFVIMGDQNADPVDGGSVAGAIQQLLDHPLIDASFVPRSDGGRDAAEAQKGRNTEHRGNPEHDTADFNDDAVGNLRVDYVLPSRDLRPVGGGVFWPSSRDPLARLVRMDPPASSDHRLVYLDLVPDR